MSPEEADEAIARMGEAMLAKGQIPVHVETDLCEGGLRVTARTEGMSLTVVFDPKIVNPLEVMAFATASPRMVEGALKTVVDELEADGHVL